MWSFMRLKRGNRITWLYSYTGFPNFTLLNMMLIDRVRSSIEQAVVDCLVVTDDIIEELRMGGGVDENGRA